MRDYYEVLQVHQSADLDVITAAYRRLALKYHPDVNPGAEAHARMQELNEAYSVLSDPRLREEYDRTRSQYANWTRTSEWTTQPPINNEPHTQEPQISRALGFWFRWIAVLPAGILAGILVHFPIHWAVLIIRSWGEEDDGFGLQNLPPETLERLAVAFFTPFTFIGVGAKVAPTLKLPTAAVLGLLWGILLGAILSYSASSGAYEGWGWLEFAAVSCLNVAGVVSAVYSTYSTGNQCS